MLTLFTYVTPHNAIVSLMKELSTGLQPWCKPIRRHFTSFPSSCYEALSSFSANFKSFSGIGNIIHNNVPATLSLESKTKQR
jgi:hypothetical protein